MCSQRLAGASLLVFANKQDIEGALSDEQIREASPARAPRASLHTTALTCSACWAQELELDKFCAKRHWRICACSAFTGGGLAVGVDWMVQDIASRIFMYD